MWPIWYSTSNKDEYIESGIAVWEIPQIQCSIFDLNPDTFA